MPSGKSHLPIGKSHLPVDRYLVCQLANLVLFASRAACIQTETTHSKGGLAPSIEFNFAFLRVRWGSMLAVLLFKVDECSRGWRAGHRGCGPWCCWVPQHTWHNVYSWRLEEFVLIQFFDTICFNSVFLTTIVLAEVANTSKGMVCASKWDWTAFAVLGKHERPREKEIWSVPHARDFMNIRFC